MFKQINYVTLILFISILLLGCSDRRVSNEEAMKLPVCIETADNEYTLSKGTIGEHLTAIRNWFGQDKADIHKLKPGQHLSYDISGFNYYFHTKFTELEKGACMEIVWAKQRNLKTGKEIEAESSNSIDFNNLLKISEFVFKF